METLAPPPVAEADIGQEIRPVELEQQHLQLSLVEKGLISQELYESGVLNSFEADEATGVDALSHILVGDEFGGAHHLPTILELGTDRVVASTIHDPERPDKTINQFRKQQKMKQSGVFQPQHIEMRGEDGTVFRKEGGASMFPNEWSTQQVLEAVLETSRVPGDYDEARGSIAHMSEINGVRVRVVTDSETGKIITGYPQ